MRVYNTNNDPLLTLLLDNIDWVHRLYHRNLDNPIVCNLITQNECNPDTVSEKVDAYIKLNSIGYDCTRGFYIDVNLKEDQNFDYTLKYLIERPMIDGDKLTADMFAGSPYLIHRCKLLKFAVLQSPKQLEN